MITYFIKKLPVSLKSRYCEKIFPENFSIFENSFYYLNTYDMFLRYR